MTESSDDNILNTLVAQVSALGNRRRLVGIDGVDGSGKTMFAGELADALRAVDTPVTVIHVDDFHHLREKRYGRGRTSAEGFWLDSYDYLALERDVLSPLSEGGSGAYRPKATDLNEDTYIDSEISHAPTGSVTIVEGIFIHRNELARWWDFSIFLHVPFTISATRMADRDGSPPDSENPIWDRYVQGQRLYFADCEPWDRASVIIDNTDWIHRHLASSHSSSPRP